MFIKGSLIYNQLHHVTNIPIKVSRTLTGKWSVSYCNAYRCHVV